jgi:hypothetical protein
MTGMQRTRLGAGSILLACGVLLLAVGVNRSRLPYNEQGRYFDPRESVVYHDGARDAYLSLGAALALGGSLLVISPLIAWRSRNSAA